MYSNAPAPGVENLEEKQKFSAVTHLHGSMVNLNDT